MNIHVHYYWVESMLWRKNIFVHIFVRRPCVRMWQVPTYLIEKKQSIVRSVKKLWLFVGLCEEGCDIFFFLIFLLLRLIVSNSVHSGDFFYYFRYNIELCSRVYDTFNVIPLLIYPSVILLTKKIKSLISISIFFVCTSDVAEGCQY